MSFPGFGASVLASGTPLEIEGGAPPNVNVCATLIPCYMWRAPKGGAPQCQCVCHIMLIPNPKKTDWFQQHLLCHPKLPHPAFRHTDPSTCMFAARPHMMKWGWWLTHWLAWPGPGPALSHLIIVLVPPPYTINLTNHRHITHHSTLLRFQAFCSMSSWRFLGPVEESAGGWQWNS